MAEEIRILVDADSCPVKDEVYKVAARHQVAVSIVSNNFIKIPDLRFVERIIVGSDFDAADNYIAERAGPGTIVVTADILLADRCLNAKATVIAPNGNLFTVAQIGSAKANRSLMEDLRASGIQVGGPAPFSNADRSRFLGSLHNALVGIKRG